MALESYHLGTNSLQPEPLLLGFATRSPESSRGSGGNGMGAGLRQTEA